MPFWKRRSSQAATTAGVATTAGIGGAYWGAVASLTGPAANLGGYIISAKVLGGAAHVAAAPVIAAVGGPAVVAGAVAVAGGAAVAGTIYAVGNVLEE